MTQRDFPFRIWGELRYGLGDEHPLTLDELGRTFNVTRERIRQIEAQSLKKLQNLQEAQQLRDDVEIASGYALGTVGYRSECCSVFAGSVDIRERSQHVAPMRSVPAGG